VAGVIWIPGTLVHARPADLEFVSMRECLVEQALAEYSEVRQRKGWGLDTTSPFAIGRPVRGIETAAFSAVFSVIGSGLFSTGLAGAIGVNAFNAVVTALTYVVGFGALAGASLLLAGGQSQRSTVRPPQSQKQSYELEDGPRTIVLGRARVGGVWAIRASTGKDTYRLLAQCQGPAAAIEEYYVRNREVTVDFDGAVSSPPYARAGANYLYLFSKLGTTNQTAFSQLISAFPENWTSDHRLRGVVCTLARYISPGVTDPDFLKIWSEGYPTIGTLIRGEFIYDPRKDSTEGGSGSHRHDDVDTWEWSDNGILCCLWQATADEDKGGCGLAFSKFDLEDIADQAEIADQTRDSAQGADAERVSVISGSYTTDTERAVILAELMQSAGVRMVRLQNGKYSFHIEEDDPTPTTTVEAEDILDAIYGGDEIVTDANALELLFHSPERQWQLAELKIQDKAWARDEVSIAKTGKRVETLTLKFCPQPGQGQRVARRIFNKRRALRGTIQTNLAGLCTVSHLDGIAEMDLIEEGWAPRVEFSPQRFGEGGATLELPLIFPADLSDWDVETDEAPAPVPLADVQFSGNVGQNEITRAVLVEVASSQNAVRIEYTAADGATAYEATYREWDGLVSGPRTGMAESGLYAETASDLEVGDRHIYEVRGYNAESELGLWSEEVDYTAAFDTSVPQSCSASLELDDGASDESPGFGNERVWNVLAICNDINLSKIDGVYRTPYSTHTVDVIITGSHEEGSPDPVWVWDDPPTGTVIFANSTGQTTSDGY